jgi:low affinity Fe/Cu permease
MLLIQFCSRLSMFGSFQRNRLLRADFIGCGGIGDHIMNGDRTKRPGKIQRGFSRVANTIAWEAGRPWAFLGAALIVIIWAATGPMFKYSDTWQLVINTGTTIVTFLMVFLIQNSQNRDSAAIQVKLDELIRVSAAKNFFVGIEHLTDEEIDRLRDAVEKRTKSRSVKEVNEEAQEAADNV